MSDKRHGFSRVKLVIGQAIGPIALFGFLVAADVAALYVTRWMGMK